MPVFAYRARTSAGRAEHGLVDAESARGAWQQLRARGVYPVDLRAGLGSGRGGRVSASELAAAMRQLASLVEADVPVDEALASAAEESTADALRRALTIARARLREGGTLADALDASPHVFPALARALVRAGETSGALAPVLARLAAETEATAARRARLRSALAYPLVMAVTTLAVLVFLLVWVVPQVAALFAETGTRLPIATRLLLAGATVARATWWIWPTAAIGLGVAAARWVRTAAGRARLDRMLIALPGVGGLARTSAVARLSRTLAIVLAHGMPLDAGLDLAARASGNAVVASRLGMVREAVRRGDPLARALASADVAPPGVCRLVATAERTGALADAFARAADVAEAEVERALATATSLVEPVLVLGMGGAVLFLVLAVLVPILTLSPLGAHP